MRRDAARREREGVGPGFDLIERVEAPGVGDIEWNWSGLPARAGVVVLEDGEGRTVLIATTADVRAWAVRRFAPREEGEKTTRAELRGVARVVRAGVVGSRFEADLAYLGLARERLAHAHRAVTDRWQGWFVHVDWEDEHPRFVKCVTRSLGGDEWRRGALVGPFANKHAAGRAMEGVTELFDLCRYHHLLVQTPHARACAYKEMGKCPAPCDGSERLERYRRRVRESVELMRGGVEREKKRAESRMKESAGEQAFEDAAREKEWIERLKAVSGRGCGWARTLDGVALVAVAQGADKETGRVFAIGAGRVEVVCDVGLEEGRDAWEEAAVRGRERAGSLLSGFGWSEEELDTLGLVCDRMYAPRSGTRFGSVGFAWVDGVDGGSLMKLARKTLVGEDEADDDRDGLEIGAET